MRPTRLLRSAVVLRPSTILRFHRSLVKRKNPRFGYQRIADQISLAFGIPIDKDTVRIIGFAVHRETLDGPAVCRMLGRVIGSIEPPSYLSSDNDPLFEFHRWKANLRVLDIEEIKTVPYVPISHPFVERLIGTIRREYVDQVPFWNARDLERKLSCFQDYDNRKRAHQGLGGNIPDPNPDNPVRSAARLDNYRWESCCRGLYQLPIAA